MASSVDKENWENIATRNTLPYSLFYEEWQVRERLGFADSLEKGALVLDLGCGVGRDSTLFSNLGLACAGLDFSREMLQRSTMRNVVNANMINIPFRKNVFDGVWSCSSLKYLMNHDLLMGLEEVRRVLKFNGLFWVGIELGEGKVTEQRAGVNVTFMRYNHFDEILENNGFKIISIDHIDAWQPFINYLCKGV